MPLVGFGTWQLSGREAYRAVRDALDAGYRLIDTATTYANEAEIGEALRDSGIARQEVFVTTKILPGSGQSVAETIATSLETLRVDHVDLWLIHWPPGDGSLVSTWEQVLEVRARGFTTDVGVSNFSVEQIERIVASTGEVPVVNQVPWAPSHHDVDFLDVMRNLGVVVEGYSPFTLTDMSNGVLTRIARRHDVEPSQVIVRWHIQHEIVVIPKSARADRIARNIDVWDFALDDEEMRALDGLFDAPEPTDRHR